MEKSERIKELVELLNKAGRAYYQEAEEIMSNFEYDKLYDELLSLEKETGTSALAYLRTSANAGKYAPRRY